MRLYATVKVIFAIGAATFVTGCFPADITGRTPSGQEITLLFYPGGDNLDDLVIFDGQNYFGTAQYQIDDPLADIGFRFNSGERIQAECIVSGKDILGMDECRRYEVYRSSWDIIPEGTLFYRPEIF
ncbi:MAG: hypothetical protein GDA53_03470 [Rhodobacteraceae bacterium]|nr:hypothetical protein [Paracoccaceae bacterium]